VAVKYISDADGMACVNEWLGRRKYFTFDIETGPQDKWIGTSFEKDAALDPYLGKPVLFLIGDHDDQFIVDVRASLDLTTIGKAIEDPDVMVLGTNLRFDTKFVMHHYGWYPAHLVDNQITEQIIRAGIFSADDKVPIGQIRKMTSMASLVRFYFDQEIDKDKEMRLAFWRTPVGQFSERQMSYFEGDVTWPEKIARAQKPIYRERGLGATLDLEYDLIPVIADMELEGIILDQDKWLGLYQDACVNVDAAQKALDAAFGLRVYLQESLFGPAEIQRKINWGSSSQLALLLHKAGYAGFVDENGKTLTTESKRFIIAKLMNEIPAHIADPIIAMRKAEQRRDSYGLNFINGIHPITRRIHPDFTQACLVTGRISGSPGVQTIPRDPAYRASFVAGEGYTLSIVDASQIEARIIADLTNDPVAVATFNNGPNPDIYKSDGELFYNTIIDKNTPEGKKLRDNAKAAWLGLGYGQGKTKFRIFMMLNTGRVVTQAESDELYDRFFEVHTVMKAAMDEWSMSADPEYAEEWVSDALAEKLIDTQRVWEPLYNSFLRKGRGDTEKAKRRTRALLANRDRVRCSTAFRGRKRHFRVDYLGWWNAARNAPVQGGAATIQKESMLEVARLIRRRGYKAKLVNVVHDEIITRVKKEDAEEFHADKCRVLVEVGSRYLQRVPMKVAGELSDFWKKT
jgi:DNA polymerase I-like protein with 3'-5' exonuclease and polymerase domains